MLNDKGLEAAAQRILARTAAGEVDLRDIAHLMGESWDQDLIRAMLELTASGISAEVAAVPAPSPDLLRQAVEALEYARPIVARLGWTESSEAPSSEQEKYVRILTDPIDATLSALQEAMKNE